MASDSVREIAEILHAARERKGLSQRALAATLGVRQSYISRIENAGVDPQASSLIEIARALDLELVLVPRRLVPAVKALQRQAEPNDLPEFVSAVHNALRRIQRQIRTVEAVSGSQKVLTVLDKTINDILPLRFGALTGVQIQTLLEQIGTTLKQTRGSPAPAVDKPISKEALETLERLARQLRDLRNRVARQIAERPVEQVPAYRLDAENGDG